jgi:hypothetical protein
VEQAGPPAAGEERNRLHAHLSEKGLTHLADAVENSRIAVAGADLRVVTAKSYKLYLEDSAFKDAVREVFGRPLRVQITLGEVGEQGAAPVATKSAPEDDATSRALANPEVRRFREVFGGEIRKVRNLKE